MPTTTEFQYFLNKRTTLLIVSWTGELLTHDVATLERCQVEVRVSPQKFIIFNLHGFNGYDSVLAGNIVGFQNLLRSKASFMLIAGLEGPTRERMLEKGLVKESELSASLKDALQLMLKICPP